MKTKIVEYIKKGSDYTFESFIQKDLKDCVILAELEGIIDLNNIQMDSMKFNITRRFSLYTFQYEKLFDIDTCTLYIIIGEKNRSC
jgi:hypothetical protein